MSDLVVLSLERWDDVWRRNQYLVSGLLNADPDLRVLFVEPPVDPLHDLRRGRRIGQGEGLRRVDDRLFTTRPVKWLPRRIDGSADLRLSRSVRAAARTLGMSSPTLWVNDPGSAQIAKDTGWPTLYDITDDWLVADRRPAERKRIAAGEEWLLAHAAVVVACSAELVRRKAPQRSDIVLVQNGVDAARYLAPAARPADLPASPYALYLGTLHRDRLDVDLCVQTADALRGRGHLALVGPEAWSHADGERVGRSGALVLGARPRDEVPGYLQHADVLVVPHRIDPFTDSLDPLKLYEYQAVGRPVVSTPVAGFRDAPGVTIAPAADFPAAVASLVPAATRFPEGADPGAADWSTRVARFRTALRSS